MLTLANAKTGTSAIGSLNVKYFILYEDDNDIFYCNIY